MSSLDRSVLAQLRFEDLRVGQSASLEQKITAADVDRFAELTGDRAPLHMDEAFAQSRGFRTRVVHGLLGAGYFSRLFRMPLPGQDCILQSVSLKWVSPAHIGDILRLTATIVQMSEAVAAFVATVIVEDVATGTVLARGKVQAGFTK